MAMRAVCNIRIPRKEAALPLETLQTDTLTAIQAPSQPPQVHPHDRVLLRPLATLGKPQVSGTSVSFLRRTEYISNANTTNKVSPFHRQPSRSNSSMQRTLKRKSPEPEAGTPAHIKRKIDKSFEAAQESLKDKSRIRHPTKAAVGKNKGLKVVEAYSILPDLDAFPDSGTYVTYKFAHPPQAGSKDGYDKRLQTSLLKYIGRTAEEEIKFKQQVEAYEHDPTNNPKPPQQAHYELYLAESPAIAENLRTRFDLNNPDRDAENPDVPGLATAPSGKPAYPYKWSRSYLSTIELELDHHTKYDEEVAVALDANAKTAWYYPIMQRNRLEPPRRIYHAEERKLEVDGYEFEPADPIPEIADAIEQYRAVPRYRPVEVEEEDEPVEEQASHNGDGSPQRSESEEPPARRRDDSEDRRDESEQDAEGDEED